MKRIGIAIALAASVAACRGSGHTVAEGSAAEELAALDASLDRLEARLIADQGLVALWSELRDRHESVSALACQNVAEHEQSIVALAERQREKRFVMAHKRRVAAQFVPKAAARE